MRRGPITISLVAAIIATVVVRPTGPAQAATAYDVGVIPSTRSCPAGSEAIAIRMDDEDDNNNANSRGGYHGAIFSDHNGTEFFFCRIDGRVLRTYWPVCSRRDRTRC